MKKNLPVTATETVYRDSAVLISKTDMRGVITYANADFIEVSGYSENELLGKSHNLVRHPDMPPAAFADLWRQIQAGKLWHGFVKNRCKNGDYYWVESNVSPSIPAGWTNPSTAAWHTSPTARRRWRTWPWFWPDREKQSKM